MLLEKNVKILIFFTKLIFNLLIKYLALKVEDQLKLVSNEMKISNGSDARHIKIVITEAYDSFVAIQHIRADFAKGSR